MKPLVEKAFDGYNCTLLASGQTGTGKSYTMGFENSVSKQLKISQNCSGDQPTNHWCLKFSILLTDELGKQWYDGTSTNDNIWTPKCRTNEDFNFFRRSVQRQSI